MEILVVKMNLCDISSQHALFLDEKWPVQNFDAGPPRSAGTPWYSKWNVNYRDFLLKKYAIQGLSTFGRPLSFLSGAIL